MHVALHSLFLCTVQTHLPSYHITSLPAINLACRCVRYLQRLSMPMRLPTQPAPPSPLISPPRAHFFSPQYLHQQLYQSPTSHVASSSSPVHEAKQVQVSAHGQCLMNQVKALKDHLKSSYDMISPYHRITLWLCTHHAWPHSMQAM